MQRTREIRGEGARLSVATDMDAVEGQGGAATGSERRG
jgi:hypothetical protein